jgi:hypothetical protein
VSGPTADLNASYRIADEYGVDASDPRLDRIRRQFGCAG